MNAERGCKMGSIEPFIKCGHHSHGTNIAGLHQYRDVPAPCPHHNHHAPRSCLRGLFSCKFLLGLLLLLSVFFIALEHFEMRTTTVHGATLLVVGAKHRQYAENQAYQAEQAAVDEHLVRQFYPQYPVNATPGPVGTGVPVYRDRLTVPPDASRNSQSGGGVNDRGIVAPVQSSGALTNKEVVQDGAPQPLPTTQAVQVPPKNLLVTTRMLVHGQEKPLPSPGPLGNPINSPNQGIVVTQPVLRNPKPTSTITYVTASMWGQYFKKRPEKVNPYVYSNIINEPSICYTDSTGKAKPEPKLLVLVLSSAENVENRKFVRLTWGKSPSYNNHHFQIVFLVGKNTDEGKNHLIEEESKIHHDIIQDNFNDTYMNLTIKSLMGLRWSVKYCPIAPYVMKTDDDMILNVDLVFLTAQINAGDVEGVLMGFRYRRAIVKRLGRWAVTYEQYPFAHYPDYTAGVGYLMSRDVAATFSHTAEYIPIFPMEDVYVTGILAETTGTQIHHAPNFPRWMAKDSDKLNFHNGALIGAHHLPLSQKYKSWQLKFGTLDEQTLKTI